MAETVEKIVSDDALKGVGDLICYLKEANAQAEALLVKLEKIGQLKESQMVVTGSPAIG